MKQQKTPAQQEYDRLVKQVSPRSEVFGALIKAFVVGGLICCLGQGLNDIGEHLLLLDKASESTLTSTALIFLSALLTGLGVYDKLGQFAGAGSIVPITGFASSRPPWNSNARALCSASARRCLSWRGLCWFTALLPR